MPGRGATAHDLNRRLGRGINLGNTLDAPSDGARRFRLAEPYLDEVRAAGFNTVRLPVRWSGHAAEQAPFTIERAFADCVDWAIDRALERGLNVVLNVHHYDELQTAPDAHAARFLGLWGQIAPRYAARSDRLYLELLNEPRDAMTPERWNVVLAEALAIVRESNPHRAVIIGSAHMNDGGALADLRLPEDDRLIVTMHYYRPFEFTHQGAAWVPDADRWLGTSWGTSADRAAVRGDLEAAGRWATAQGRPLFVGEFGAYAKADMASRVRWTTFVRSEAERLGMSWAYWDLATDFGAFDPQRNAWRTPLRHALVGS
jgi:endoglucanase